MYGDLCRGSWPAFAEATADVITDEDRALAERFLDAIEQLNRDLAIPTQLAALQEADIPDIARAARLEADTGYPVPRYMTQEQCELLIRQVLPPAAEAAKKPASKKAAPSKPAKKAPAKKAAPRKKTA